MEIVWASEMGKEERGACKYAKGRRWRDEVRCKKSKSVRSEGSSISARRKQTEIGPPSCLALHVIQMLAALACSAGTASGIVPAQ